MVQSITAAFRDEHEALFEIVGEMHALVANPEPADAVLLFHLRRRFSQQLTAHLHGEDWVLYPRLRASKDKTVAALADRLSREMGDLSARYSAYARHWTTSAARGDWPGFRAATIEVLDALAERMERENDELYPCADKDVDDAAKGLRAA